MSQSPSIHRLTFVKRGGLAAVLLILLTSLAFFVTHSLKSATPEVIQDSEENRLPVSWKPSSRCPMLRSARLP